MIDWLVEHFSLIFFRSLLVRLRLPSASVTFCICGTIYGILLTFLLLSFLYRFSGPIFMRLILYISTYRFVLHYLLWHCWLGYVAIVSSGALNSTHSLTCHVLRHFRPNAVIRSQCWSQFQSRMAAGSYSCTDVQTIQFCNVHVY